MRSSDWRKNVAIGDSSIHRSGVIALREFAPDEAALEIDDSRLVDEQHPLIQEEGEFPHHCDYLADGKTILMQPPERYINSSCDPNTYVKTVDGVRLVIARRPIVRGEEITYDYIINCHGGEIWQCHCGSERCRRMIVSSFFDLPLSLQREYAALLDG